MDFKNHIDDSYWLRSVQHLPIMQTIISVGYFLELQFLEQDAEQIKSDFFVLTQKVKAKFQESEEVDKSEEEEIRKLAKQAYETKMYTEQVEGIFYDMKILEAFLEGAPQTVLQLYIVLTTCNIENFQWVTLITSFMAYTKNCCEIFLRCPTEVSLCFKVVNNKLKTVSISRSL